MGWWSCWLVGSGRLAGRLSGTALDQHAVPLAGGTADWWVDKRLTGRPSGSFAGYLADWWAMKD